jgi:alpha-tubulin suppressor-like RCC1 family protein
LFSFGNNAYGQLGFGDNKKRNYPEEVTFFQNENILSISSGGDFSIAICESKKVFSWGNNSYGQLGIGGFYNEMMPKEIEFFKGMDVLQIACGNDHCMALDGILRYFLN